MPIMIDQAPSRRVLLGVSLVCFANLLLEVVLTRIFSATMYYHFTFLAISLALLGLGASGVWVYVFADRYQDDLPGAMARNARAFALTTLLALVYVLANPIDIITGTSEIPTFTNRTLLQMLLLNGVSALPFFFAGMVVSLAVQQYRAAINRLYFWDLCGAATAALITGVLIRVVGGPALIVVVMICASSAALLFDGGRRSKLAVGSFTALIVLALTTSMFALPSVKGVKIGRVVFEGWNTFSRITVEKLKDGGFDIKIDASASTRVTSAAQGANWSNEISAFAYHMIEGGPDEALIIGPGGGRDVSHAINSGAKHVTGVEVNPIIAETIMKHRFLDASGSLYLDPRVHVVVDEGRSFVRRSRGKYDVIQASLVDTWAATSAGAFALTENTLYTLEAFQDYFAHLTDRGVVTMSRWFTGEDPETIRLLVLASGALEKGGVAAGDARKHLYLVTNGQLGTMVAKRTEFTADELDRLDAAAKAAHLTVVLSPRTPGTSDLERLVDAGAWSPAVRAYPKNVLPPTDDKPFFFYFVKPGEFLDLGRHFNANAALTDPALWILSAFGITLIILTVLFIFVPLVVYRRADLAAGGDRTARRRRALGLGYFALIGLAFMTIEMALMQKFSLFLGHPTYALLVVLFAILVGTAAGARLSGGLSAGPRRIAFVAGALVALVAAVCAVVLPGMLHAWVGWALPARIALAGIMVATFGLLMGCMLPAGISLVSVKDPQIVSWAWGINGGASVIATVGATVLAINLGFIATLVCGAALYAVAGVAAFALGEMAGQR